MAYDSRQIANEFIRLAEAKGRSLSIMSLLKLTYIAHGWTLALTGRPLLADGIEAWEYGPVVPNVYFGFRDQGVHDMAAVKVKENEFDPSDKSIVDQVYNIYGEMSPFRLSRLTHVAGGPWDMAATKSIGTRIPNDLIKKHYLDKLEKSRRQENRENAR